jgi:hypothetical protein
MMWFYIYTYMVKVLNTNLFADANCQETQN